MKQLPAFFLVAALAAVSPLPTAAQQQQPVPGAGANYETRLSTLEDEVRALTGQVEQLDYSIRRVDQSLQRLQQDYDGRLSRLEAAQQAAAQQAALPPPTIVQSPMPATPSAPPAAAPANPETPINGTLGALKMQDGHVTGGVNNPQAPPLPEAPPDYGLTPQEQYEQAFALLRQANYDEAGKAFKAFIDKNPKDKMIGNAKYWYAETLYVRGRFNDAAVAFADAFQQEPQGAKAPDSLLKLAMSLGAINKTADACTALSELRTKYPGASASVRSRASEERTKFKCAAP